MVIILRMIVNTQCLLTRTVIYFICATHYSILGNIYNAVFHENAVDFMTAGYVTSVRKGVKSIDYSQIEITAKPYSMVDNVHRIAKGGVSLGIKSGNGSWTTVDRQPVMRGGLYKWIQPNIIPCNEHQIRLNLSLNDKSQTSFLYPHVIQPASSDSLISSGYKLAAPEELEIVLTLYSIVISWPVSPCVSLYSVTYQQVRVVDKVLSEVVPASKNPSLTLVGKTEDCREYNIQVTGVLGTLHSMPREHRFYTAPREDMMKGVEVDITPSLDGVTVSWNSYDDLSCIDRYIITICDEENNCPVKDETTVDNSEQYLHYSSPATLSQCFHYSLHIQPVFPGARVKEKVLYFQTLYPPLQNISSLDSVITAKARPDQMMRIDWPPVECADHYTLYRRTSTRPRWEHLLTTHHSTALDTVAPCVEYSYRVTAAVGDKQTQFMEMDQPVKIKSELSSDLVITNLSIVATPGGANLSWDHNICVESYRIRSCTYQGIGKTCYEQQVMTEGLEVARMNHSLANMAPCSQFSTSIFPTVGGSELGSEEAVFTTRSLEPAWPAVFSVLPGNITGKRMSVGWARVECVAGYKLETRDSGGEVNISYHNASEVGVIIDKPQPCVTVR